MLAERAVPSGTRHAELLTPAITGVLADAGRDAGRPRRRRHRPRSRPVHRPAGRRRHRRGAGRRARPAGVGVCSLDAIGSGARTVVTDARRKEIYWAAYDADGARTDGPAVVRPEELGRPGPFVGDPAFAARLGPPSIAADVTTAGLLRAAGPQLADPSSAGPLTPLYLRRPDATPPTAIKAVSQA